MAAPAIEFFTDTIDDVDYMNIGIAFEKDGLPVKAVIGAIEGTLTQDQMKIIGGVAEEACRWVLGLNDA